MKNLPIIGLISLSLVAIALVIYGVVTHSEAGFTKGGSSRWRKNDFPIPIAILKEDSKLTELNHDALEGAISALNSRLGFEAFQMVPPTVLAHEPEAGHVHINFQVPYEKDKMEHSGLATCEPRYCQVDICNTATLAATSLAVRHELGHALGLAHDDFEDSLMYGGELKEGQQYRLTDYDRSIIRLKYMP